MRGLAILAIAKPVVGRATRVPLALLAGRGELESVMITKRRFLQAAASAAAMLATPRAFAIGNPSYPSRNVKWVVPYAPGGATDVLSRLLCQRLSDRLGQTFVVENKPGAAAISGRRRSSPPPPTATRCC